MWFSCSYEDVLEYQRHLRMFSRKAPGQTAKVAWEAWQPYVSMLQMFVCVGMYVCLCVHAFV